jgi:hypothetical protein
MSSFKNYLSESKGSSYNWNDYRSIAQFTLDEKEKARYIKAIDAFEKGIENKHIWNADFKDLYSYDFSRNYERIIDKLKNDVYFSMSEEDKQKYNDVYWINTTPVGIKKSFKEVTPHKNVFPALYDALEKMQTFPDMLKELKGYIEKGRKVSDEKKEAKVAFQAIVTGSQAQRIKDVLQKSVDELRPQYEQMFIKQDLDRVQKAYAQKDAIIEKEKLTTAKYRWKNYLSRPVPILGHIINQNGELRDDWKDYVIKQAKEDVKFILEGFVAKNVKKLATIVDKKRNLADIKLVKNNINQGNLDNELSFTFTDGAKFIVYSKTIYKYSSRGLLFTQYPTRFTNVIMSNGQRMAEPSEERMNKVFH